jgi:outer membrane protein OmpA-like peptidoglycan-associated protein/tetratricopeptide (TPR) repeat protein
MRSTRKFLFFFLSAFALHFGAQAQDDNVDAAKQLVEIANEAYFNLRVILIANEQYVQAAELDPSNIEANYMAGRTYLETNYKSRATKYLLRVYELNPNYKFNILYMIGQAYQYGLEFENAIEYYNLFLDKLSQSGGRGDDQITADEVQRRVYECGNGLEYLNAPLDYEIENVGSSINSEWDDFAPVLNADESFMVFTTRRQEGNLNADVTDRLLYYEDIFYSEKTGDNWGYAQNLGMPVNSPYHDSNIAMNAEGDQLYIYKSQNGGDIFLSEREESGAWKDPVPLNENINSTFSENSVSVSPDGTTLFFSSDRPITPDKTDLDIYYSKLDRKGNWGVAKNLGTIINTPYDEDGPFLDYDGKTLYFSSKGHKGMGGYDIYKTVYDSTTDLWSEPVNLGYPMNSPDNDIYFVSTRDGKRGYYASAREDGLGFTDIYHIRLAKLEEAPEMASNVKKEEEEKVPPPVIKPEPVPQQPEVVLQPVTLLLKTVDATTGQTIDVSLKIAKDGSGEPVTISKVDQGLYRMTFANSADVLYDLAAERAGYMFKDMTISIPAAGPQPGELKRKLSLDPIKTGFTTVLRNIYFDFGTARLKRESHQELDRVYKVMQENPNSMVEIAGHTDNIGTADFNKQLSQQRAQSVVDYLVGLGMNRSRVQAQGYGEEKPLASNDDEREGRELNRRVEFTVLKN